MDYDALRVLVGEMAKQMQDFVTAYDAKAVDIDSPKIRVGEEAPYAWHQEWLYRARALIARAQEVLDDKA
jgi:hypothetical protein